MRRPDPPTHAARPRLLVLACSARKRPDATPLPAVERYDGPAYRVLRKYLRATRDGSLAVRIVSAEHGLVRGDDAIDDYDRVLTRARVRELAPAVSAAVRADHATLRPEATLLCLGRLYLVCVGDLPGAELAAAGQGRKLAHLKAWLYDGCRGERRGQS